MNPIIHSGLAALQLTADASDADGLTLAEILANVPTDPATIFVLVLLIGSIVGILRVGRSRPPAAPGAGR